MLNPISLQLRVGVDPLPGHGEMRLSESLRAVQSHLRREGSWQQG